MGTSIRHACAVTLLFTLISCTREENVSPTPTGAAPLSSADLRAIGSIDGKYDDALRRGDLETAVRTIYAPDVVMIPGDGQPFKGQDALINHLRSLQAQNWEHRPVSTTGRGDLAVEVSEWRLSGVANGVRRSFAGGCIDVLKRQPDGSWRIISEMFTAFPAQDYPGLQELVRGTSLTR